MIMAWVLLFIYIKNGEGMKVVEKMEDWVMDLSLFIIKGDEYINK